MRPKGAWSMSTVGLTAQEISFPIENPFLRGSYCHSMAGSKSSWSARHLLDNFYFSMAAPNSDHSYPAQQKGPPLSYERDKHNPNSQRLLPKKPCPIEPSTSSPTDKDKVVPSLKKLSFQEGNSPPQTRSRCSKPLPPIPTWTDISHEQAMDSEVEFFTSSDDNSCLVSNHCSKSYSRNHVNRRSVRDCGQINHAYYEGPVGPQSPQHPQQHHQANPPQEQREQYEQQQQKQPEPVACQRLQDKAQRKLRRSHSGPAGSLQKPSFLRFTCQKRHPNCMDKPEVPPPIPPRTLKAGDYRRWSAEVSSGAYSDEDKPPKVPPRDPLSRGNSRTPSPKSLPTYSNGVMPVTQSFAPNPNYVSVRSLQRQNSEGSPRILPIMENGRKISGTHYYLLPSANSPCDCHQKESTGGSCLKSLRT